MSAVRDIVSQATTSDELSHIFDTAGSFMDYESQMGVLR